MKPFEIWRSDIPEKEIEEIRKRLGENFEKIKYRFTKYHPDITYLIEKFLEKLGKETEASLVEQRFILEKTESLWREIEKIEEKIDALEIKLDKIDDGNEKEKIKEEIKNKKIKMKEILEKEVIDEKTTESN